ncbi:MAG: 2-C-methyl-D-erythritol 4-phosphate cytidylyltransferase [Tissierellia bacterium]|nr:2-C-methyl-D-erythritol 4-phosphate cytidylyltransferase [Tissierellia bacterium]
MKFYAIVLAAGKSRRMGEGTNKLLLPLRGKTVIENTLDFFCKDERLSGILVVTSDPFIEALAVDRGCRVVAGGEERQESVLKGLALLDNDDYAFIHDGARPFLSDALFDRCFAEAKSGRAFIPGIPVTDTLKLVQNGQVEATLNRDSHILVQTPQGSPVGRLKEAYALVKEQGFFVTDDSSALELLGETVYVIEGSEDNRKITSPADMRYLK